MWLTVAAAGAVVVVLVGASAAGSLGRAAATASIDCEVMDVTYGEAISCDVDAPADAVLTWPDGTTGPAVDTTHTIAAVGPLTIEVVHGDRVLAVQTVTVRPDLAIGCDTRDLEPVYEIVASLDGALHPYDYVYLGTDGTKLHPGDDAYPANLGEMLATERVVLDEARAVGLCRSVSRALDDLGGTVTWTVESPWYSPYVTTSRHITPGTPAHWDGVQPLDVHVVIDVDGFEASERVGVYFGGCG